MSRLLRPSLLEQAGGDGGTWQAALTPLHRLLILGFLLYPLPFAELSLRHLALAIHVLLERMLLLLDCFVEEIPLT